MSAAARPSLVARPVTPLVDITYHETEIKNPVTGRWRKGPVVRRTTVYVTVDGGRITLATKEEPIT